VFTGVLQNFKNCKTVNMSYLKGGPKVGHIFNRKNKALAERRARMAFRFILLYLPFLSFSFSPPKIAQKNRPPNSPEEPTDTRNQTPFKFAMLKA